jgi:hypothetical protein
MRSQYELGKISETDLNLYISHVVELMKKQDADIRTISTKFNNAKEEIFKNSSSRKFLV